MSSQIFNILVVDDNVTCLNIISSMLRRWKYEVITVNCPLKALAITRTQDIDLILSDLYMPKMNGLELQKQVDAESKLPVIIMSSDDNEKIIFKSLSSGAVFFISKPVNLMDLKNLWQYAIASKRDISMRYIEKIKSIQAAGSLAIGGTSYNGENNFALFGNETRHTENIKDNRRKFQKKNKEKEEAENSTTLKKTKVNWNHALHNRFMQAIRHITLEKAVPKNILEFMNVPGLTRENVASHLQKYRIFLKKVGENGSVAAAKNSMTLDRTFRSSFAVGHSSMMLNNSQETHSPFKRIENQTSALHSFNPANNSSLASFSSSSYGFGQSHLLVGNSNIQANVHKPFPGNINPLYQSNRTGGFWLESSDIGINMPSGGVAMPLNGTSSLQIPNNLYSNLSTPSFKTSGIWNPSYGAAGNNNVESTRTGNVSFSHSNSNVNHSNTNRCARVQMTNGGNLMAEGGQLRLNGGLSGASDFGLSLINNRSLGVEAVGDSAFGTFLAPIKSFSTGRNPGNNQCPTSLSSVGFVQGSTSTLPSVAQQHFSLDDNELNDFVSGFMNDDNNIASGFSEPHQFKDVANMLMETTNSQFLYNQQQGGERVENSNLTSNSSCSVETNLPTSQPQDDLEFLTPLNVEENRPWDEPSLEQLLEIQELLNSDLEDNIIDPSDKYYIPILDEKSDQQQRDI